MRSFTQEELDELGLPYGHKKSEAKLLDTIVGDEGRWGTWKTAIFEYEGEILGVEYYDPATEMQEGQDIWEQEPVPAKPYRKVEKVVEVWEPVE